MANARGTFAFLPIRSPVMRRMYRAGSVRTTLRVEASDNARNRSSLTRRITLKR